MLPYPRRKCVTCKRSPAIFGIRQQERCEEHTIEGDANLVHMDCRVCGLPDVLDLLGRCATCDPDVFQRTRLAKQREVAQYLKQNFTEYPMTSYDRIPASLRACGDKYRPDFLWDGINPFRSVVLEVDEEQHSDRSCECEQTRMINIANAIGAPQTIFVRYNPDSYVPGGAADDVSVNYEMQRKRRRVSSPNKVARLDRLCSWLKHLLDSPVDMDSPIVIGVLYLFFDGYSVSTVRVDTILARE